MTTHDYTQAIEGILDRFATHFPWKPEELKQHIYEQASDEATTQLEALLDKRAIEELADSYGRLQYLRYFTVRSSTLEKLFDREKKVVKDRLAQLNANKTKQ